MAVMYLSKENFTCTKEHNSVHCAGSSRYYFENSMKLDIKSIETSRSAVAQW